MNNVVSSNVFRDYAKNYSFPQNITNFINECGILIPNATNPNVVFQDDYDKVEHTIKYLIINHDKFNIAWQCSIYDTKEIHISMLPCEILEFYLFCNELCHNHCDHAIVEEHKKEYMLKHNLLYRDLFEYGGITICHESLRLGGLNCENRHIRGCELLNFCVLISDVFGTHMTLCDGSTKNFNSCNVSLQLLSILKNGRSWYGGHGFECYNSEISGVDNIVRKFRFFEMEQLKNELLISLDKLHKLKEDLDADCKFSVITIDTCNNELWDDPHIDTQQCIGFFESYIKLIETFNMKYFVDFAMKLFEYNTKLYAAYIDKFLFTTYEFVPIESSKTCKYQLRLTLSQLWKLVHRAYYCMIHKNK
jgi:hypothetical protein